MGEGVGGGRVGQVIRRNVNGLEGSNGPGLGGSDAFLHGTHFGGEGRLVTHGGRGAAEERRHFGTGLGETEDIVHKEQHVLVFFIAEILGHGKSGEGDAKTGTGRLVHLTVNQRDLGTGGEDGAALVVNLDVHFRFAVLANNFFAILVQRWHFLGGDNAGLYHFPVKVVTFTGSLTHPGEDGETAVAFGDVIDEFHDDDGLAYARTAEGSDFATLGEGTDQIDNLDACFENLC